MGCKLGILGILLFCEFFQFLCYVLLESPVLMRAVQAQGQELLASLACEFCIVYVCVCVCVRAHTCLHVARLKDNCCVEMVEKERIISVSTARPDGRSYVRRP